MVPYLLEGSEVWAPEIYRVYKGVYKGSRFKGP